MKVVAGYVLHEKLGSGSFAVVYKGVRLNSNNNTNNSCEGTTMTDVGMTTTTNDSFGLAPVVAIKAIDRNSDKLTSKVLSNLEKEISILRNYKHRNIVCLQDVQKTTNHFYLLLEYCAGGDLQKLIRDRANGRLSERLCRRLMKDLCSGLQFLHDYQLIHRDIKPQNLLLTGALPLDETNDPSRTQELENIRKQINFPSNQFSLKIADFGFARHLQTTSLAETLCTLSTRPCVDIWYPKIILLNTLHNVFSSISLSLFLMCVTTCICYRWKPIIHGPRNTKSPTVR